MAITKIIPGVLDLNATGADKGLKMPSGTELNRPTNATGQIRNNTNESSIGSASAQEYYNGTEWKKITNTIPVSASNILTLTRTDYIDRTMTTPTDGTKYTYSFWYKWNNIPASSYDYMWLSSGYYAASTREEIHYDYANTRWNLYYDGGASNQGTWYGPTITPPTNGVWYHYVLQKTAQQAPILYINGTNIGTWTSSAAPNPPSGDGTTTRMNSSGRLQNINGRGDSGASGIDGSIAYCQFVDGSIQAPSTFTTTSFGLTVPASYTGTWGNNGFQLLFGNPGAIGTDTSGNTNNFTPASGGTAGTDIVYY